MLVQRLKETEVPLELRKLIEARIRRDANQEAALKIHDQVRRVLLQGAQGNAERSDSARNLG